MNTIYILVKVDYDWHRFQNNLFASTEYSKVVVFAKNWNEIRATNGLYSELPMEEYKLDQEHAEQIEAINESETDHLWIQEFEQ